MIKFLTGCLLLTACLMAEKTDHMLTRLRGSYDVGEGIGYQDGYTSLETFWGYHRTDNFIGFLDAIGHVFDNGKIAANLGLGARFNIPSLSTLFGINSFYDYRRTNRFHYDQVGAGVEILSKYFDIRANGYLPFGKKSNFIRNVFDRFQGFGLIYDEVTEEVLRGVDGELGFNLVNLGPFRFYGAGGVYFFERKDCMTHLGGQGRLQMSAWQRFFAQVSITGDSLYNTRIQGQFALDVPLYSIKPRRTIHYPQLQRNLYTSVDAYLTQPVIRHPIIPVCRMETERNLRFVHPVLNIPFLFYHVNNTAPAGGDGSFEHPFNTLADAEAVTTFADVIFVNPGDLTTTGYATGFVSKLAQSFWGTGVEHVLEFGARRARVVIPAFTQFNPNITNAYGDGITLQDLVHVSGINILNPAASGISGSNVRGVNVNRNKVDTTAVNGIEIIYSSNFNGKVEILDNQVVAATIDGIHLELSDTASMTATVFRNTVKNCASMGIHVQQNDVGTQANPLIVGNTLSNNLYGVLCMTTNGTFEGAVLGNTESGSTLGSYRFEVGSGVANNPVMNFICADNTGTTSISFINETSAVATGVFKNNQLTSNGAMNIFNQAVGAFNFTGNTVASTVNFSNTGGQLGCLRLVDNSASSYAISQTSGPVSVESSTAPTSDGVEASNQGAFTFTGTIDFVAAGTCDVR
ncbi:MAG: inverse autotransporter beta domain-containing protein [Chlamydiia bacterium]|nr:inverse autotransporter beta domain-containing protein [Chlamydiia bacterium]HPE84564.1 inverse autotransporter beta domain-containing protein [Chlamydiales bacterium]